MSVVQYQLINNQYQLHHNTTNTKILATFFASENKMNLTNLQIKRSHE